MWRFRRGEGPPGHSRRPDLSTTRWTFVVISPWTSQTPPKRRAQQPGAPSLLPLPGSYLRASTTFHQKSDPDLWSRPPCSSNRQAPPRPFLISPWCQRPSPHHHSSRPVPPPRHQGAFPKPDLLDTMPHATVQSSTWAPVPARCPSCTCSPPSRNGETVNCSLHLCPPASEGTLCHPPPRGGIPWLAEDKGSSVPQPSSYSVSLRGPECSPRSPPLPPLGAKGGPRLIFGHSTHVPVVEMQPGVGGGCNGPAVGNGRGQRALISEG